MTRLEDSLQQPQAIAFTTLISKAQPYAKDDVRYHPTLKEALERTKAVKLEQLSAWHKSFWGAGDAELVMVGDFDRRGQEAGSSSSARGRQPSRTSGWRCRTARPRPPTSSS